MVCVWFCVSACGVCVECVCGVWGVGKFVVCVWVSVCGCVCDGCVCGVCWVCVCVWCVWLVYVCVCVGLVFV